MVAPCGGQAGGQTTERSALVTHGGGGILPLLGLLLGRLG